MRKVGGLSLSLSQSLRGGGEDDKVEAICAERERETTEMWGENARLFPK